MLSLTSEIHIQACSEHTNDNRHKTMSDADIKNTVMVIIFVIFVLWTWIKGSSANMEMKQEKKTSYTNPRPWCMNKVLTTETNYTCNIRVVKCAQCWLWQLLRCTVLKKKEQKTFTPSFAFRLQWSLSMPQESKKSTSSPWHNLLLHVYQYDVLSANNIPFNKLIFWALQKQLSQVMKRNHSCTW